MIGAMEEDRYEIRFCGSGGQGIILAAVVLAEAVGIYDGRAVCQTQSYGPEARGGRSQAEVVISNAYIDYPKAMKPDLLLAMNQAALDAFSVDCKPQCLIVVDSTFVDQVPAGHLTVAIPFTGIAREQLGKEIVANMVALGAVGHLCRQVSIKSLQAALQARSPKGTSKLNQQALRAGIKAAAAYDLNGSAAACDAEEDEI